jgi:hypothetical protein
MICFRTKNLPYLVTTMFLYSAQNTEFRSSTLSKYLLPYGFPWPTLKESSVAPTSQVRTIIDVR